MSILQSALGEYRFRNDDHDNVRNEQLVVERLFELRHAQLDVEETILVEEVVHPVRLEDVCAGFVNAASSAQVFGKEDGISRQNAPDRDSILPALESSVRNSPKQSAVQSSETDGLTQGADRKSSKSNAPASDSTA